MAKNITVPCHTCREEEGVNATEDERRIMNAPQRTIHGGKLLKEGEEDADFELDLSCGHTIEFTFTQEEKSDVLEVLGVPLADDDNG